MKEYTIEFSIKHNNLFRSLSIVTLANNDFELIELCDHIYGKFFQETSELVVFFFSNKDDARSFTYKLLVEEKDIHSALNDCKWRAHLKNNTLYFNHGQSINIKQFCPADKNNKTENTENIIINN